MIAQKMNIPSETPTTISSKGERFEIRSFVYPSIRVISSPVISKKVVVKIGNIFFYFDFIMLNPFFFKKAIAVVSFSDGFTTLLTV